jgi:4-amino-4-deoxy-L-arabinose transferase-like glycosyltransferase
MGTWLLLLFGGGTLLFFSVSQSKRPGYILPALPVAAILVGRSLARALEERASRGLRVSMAAAALGSWAAAAATLWFSLHPPAAVAAGEASAGFRSAGILTAVLLAALGGSLAASAFAVRARALQRGLVAVAASLFLALPSLGNVAERLDASLSVKAVSLRVASLASPTDVVASFGTILQGLNFYTGRRTVIVGGAGELEFGAQGDESRGWIIEPEELPALLAERTVYLVAPAGMTSRAIEYGAGRIRVLEETPSHVLLTNAEDPPPATP